MATWEHMFKNNTIPPNIKTIEVWSDGGPKHFKMKECMYYFSTLQHRYNTTITYNFYQSYHGHNSCDAAASHAKKRINEQQRDNNIPLNTATDLVGPINTLKHTFAQLAPSMQKSTLQVSKMDGIKSYFMYKFPDIGIITTHTDSTAVTPSKTYTLQVDAFPMFPDSRNH